MADTQDESLMQKIQALIAPPQSSPAQKPKTKKVKGNVEKTNPARQENNPFCDACGEGGSLLCCDNCPSSFHFFCCDPPVDPKNLPSGDWLCRRCLPLPLNPQAPPLFGPLLQQACTANPLEFSLPLEMQKYDVFPGVSRKLLSKKVAVPLQDGDARELYCYACNRGARAGCLVSCDFCPLVFHLDCVHPPLSTHPSSVWMCPVHAEHMMPGFDHPRLTERLRALSESRIAVSCQNVKLDFLTKINRIPHYKRLTRRHNRRTAEVPGAIKSLYASPLLDARDERSSLSFSLLTQAELVSYHRWEQKQMRKKFVTTREPAFTAEQDEWTRGAILCQLERAAPKMPSLCTPFSSGAQSSSSSTCSDSAAFSAAQGLVELSQKVHLPNGITKATTSSNNSHPDLDLVEDEETKRCGVYMHKDRASESNGSVCGDGGGCGEEDSGQSPGDVGDVGSLGNGTEQDGGSGGESSVGKEDGSLVCSSPEEETEDEVMDTLQVPFVPDITSLDPRLVKLLATQRLQQLFVASQQHSPVPTVPSAAHIHHLPVAPHVPSSSSSSSLSSSLSSSSFSASLLSARPLNGLNKMVGHKPEALYDQLSSAPVILCPISGVGSPRCLNTTVTHIGLSSDMDICLKEYGHCNYLSSQHACIFYDKLTDEYELINYSDYGSVIDGVLLSCDSADRRPPEGPPPLTIDSLLARGQGLRAGRARLRLEAAREALNNDKEKAKMAVDKALSLPYKSPVESDALTAKRGQDTSSSAPTTPTVKTRKMSSRKSAMKNGEAIVGGAIPATTTEGTAAQTATASSCEPEVNNHTRTVETDIETKVPISFNQPPLPCTISGSRSLLTSGQPSETKVEEAKMEAEEGHARPCQCQRGAFLCADRGWEGTALLHHGSRIQFGCLQFVLSVAGKPGHKELVEAFLELLVTANSL